ncbi:unnamed protein product [Ectocarpus sp. 12 AP-2014]
MNKKETTIQNLLHLPIGKVASYSSFTLYSLLAEVNDQLGQAKRAKSWLEGAMSIKYSTRIKQARTDSDKKTGIVHIEDAGIKISHDIPKKIQWDQKKLSEIIENIAEMGSDPLEYIDISYKVPEHKFISWPKSTQQIFLLARTVRAGNPSYKLSKVDKASEKEAGK